MPSSTSPSRFIEPVNRQRRAWCPSAATAAPCAPYAPIFRHTEPPERFVLSLGRNFSVEPNLLEPIRTDLREQSASRPGICSYTTDSDSSWSSLRKAHRPWSLTWP